MRSRLVIVELDEGAAPIDIAGGTTLAAPGLHVPSKDSLPRPIPDVIAIPVGLAPLPLADLTVNSRQSPGGSFRNAVPSPCTAAVSQLWSSPDTSCG